MSAVSAIEWTDRTWNPVRGCSRVSPGCDRCYAMHFAHRFSGEGGVYEGLTVLRPKTASRPGVDWSGRARFVPEMLSEPLRWRKPQRVFVNSMSDLFHESLEDWQIDRVFGVMWATLYLGRGAVPGHTYQILTKRPKRALDYFSADRRRAWADAAAQLGGDINPDGIHDQVMFHKGPHPRIWLGVSTENQRTAEERIPLLLKLPAAVRFISAEPLLGPIDLTSLVVGDERELNALRGLEQTTAQHVAVRPDIKPSLDWVIVGGESGNGARPFHVDWARALVQQCATAGVACFVKQLGDRPQYSQTGGFARAIAGEVTKPTKRKGGDMAEWPEALRVRQFPAVRRLDT